MDPRPGSHPAGTARSWTCALVPVPLTRRGHGPTPGFPSRRRGEVMDLCCFKLLSLWVLVMRLQITNTPSLLVSRVATRKPNRQFQLPYQQALLVSHSLKNTQCYQVGAKSLWGAGDQPPDPPAPMKAKPASAFHVLLKISGSVSCFQDTSPGLTQTLNSAWRIRESTEAKQTSLKKAPEKPVLPPTKRHATTRTVRGATVTEPSICLQTKFMLKSRV